MAKWHRARGGRTSWEPVLSPGEVEFFLIFDFEGAVCKYSRCSRRGIAFPGVSVVNRYLAPVYLLVFPHLRQGWEVFRCLRTSPLRWSFGLV
jgi:hypothetical protein